MNTGKKWEQDVKSSFLGITGTWIMRIPDGRGGERVADSILLYNKYQCLLEMKDRQKLSYHSFSPKQWQHMLYFHHSFYARIGLVAVKLNPDVKFITDVESLRNFLVGRTLNENNYEGIRRCPFKVIDDFNSLEFENYLSELIKAKI